MKTKMKVKTKTKRVLKKKYDTATIYYGDDRVWTFKLTEWTLYLDYDWIEVVRVDGKGMEMFAVANVAQISYTMDTVKEVEGTKAEVVPIKSVDPSLKPVA